MKHWINKLRSNLIHMLGGYTADEATHNRKIKSLRSIYAYTDEMLHVSKTDVHSLERAKAMHSFIKDLEPYVNVEEKHNKDTGVWLLRLSVRIVDNELL